MPGNSRSTIDGSIIAANHSTSSRCVTSCTNLESAKRRWPSETDFCDFQRIARSKAYLLRSRNRATQMALVRYYSTLFQDQLQTPYIADVIERIGGDHYQVGELAHLHCAQFGADAAHRSAMARGRYQRLPRCRPIANPQPHLEQRGFLERADVRTQCHSHTSIERF